jgi:hypothetical protein
VTCNDGTNALGLSNQQADDREHALTHACAPWFAPSARVSAAVRGAGRAVLVVICAALAGCGESQPSKRSTSPTVSRRGDATAPASQQRRKATIRHLYRALHPPRDKGGRCPVSTGRRPAPEAGIAIGDGPAYAVLGFSEPPPGGMVPLRDDPTYQGRQYHKLLIAVQPRYRGALLLRGGKSGGPRVRFHTDPRPTEPPDPKFDELQFGLAPRPSHQRGWRYEALTVVLHGPGCYFIQFDGSSFSNTATFKAAAVDASRQSDT